MKRRLMSSFLVMVLVVSVLSMPASAINPLASEQIARYYSYLVPCEDGEFGVVFSISGTDIMNRIGAKEIKIYQQIDGRWTWVKTFNANSEGMCDTNTSYHANTIYYKGISGKAYKVDVTIFAEDAAGSDSRTETHYITAP